MNRKLAYALIALICGSFFSSCVPYDENGNRIVNRPMPKRNGTVTDPKQQEIEAKREELRKKEEARKKAQASKSKTDDFDSNGEKIVKKNSPIAGGDGEVIKKTTTSSTPVKNHPVALKVPGKEGFVFSPFNNKVVDVRGYGSGTLVADPQFPASEKKHFRVP